MKPIGRRNACLAAFVIGGCCIGAAALGFDFRDREIVLQASYTVERRNLVDGSADVDKSPDGILEVLDAIGGKIFWHGGSTPCTTAMVFVPGRSFSGNADCKPERLGTASNWVETSSTATFKTDARMDGDVLTLRGEMRGTKSRSTNICNRIFGSSTERFTVVRALKMRFKGDTCEVLEFSDTYDTDESGETNGNPHHDTHHWVFVVKPGTCTVAIRSTFPPAEPNHWDNGDC